MLHIRIYRCPDTHYGKPCRSAVLLAYYGDREPLTEEELRQTDRTLHCQICAWKGSLAEAEFVVAADPIPWTR